MSAMELALMCFDMLDATRQAACRRWNDSRVHQYVPSSYEPIQGDGIPLTAQP
jgi:hypothetical protein